MGLMADTWRDTIPDDTVTTGVAFEYDAPAAVAPQAILLAVASPGQSTWETAGESRDHLACTVREAEELARLRAADPEALREMWRRSGLDQFLPAIYAPVNFENATPSMNLANDVVIIATN